MVKTRIKKHTIRKSHMFLLFNPTFFGDADDPLEVSIGVVVCD
jgi:hypothetical protein